MSDRKRQKKGSVSKKAVVLRDVADVIDNETGDGIIRNRIRDDKSTIVVKVSSEDVIVALKHPASLFFKGVIDAKAIAGSFETMGFQVNDDDTRSYTLFSLEDSHASYISTVHGGGYTTMTGKNLSILDNYGLSDDSIYKLVNHVGCTGTVVLLLNAAWRFRRWEDFLSNLNIKVFPPKLRKRGFSLYPDAEEALEAVLDDAGGTRIQKKLNFCQDWDVVMSAFPKDQQFKVLFCGGKGVGKSTTMRYMINRRLQMSPKVLVIDLDIGQSEFTLCGSVSAVVVYTPLLGPNYTHLRNPSKTFFVGDIDVTTCMKSYLEALKALFNYCLYNPQFSNCPWFINTMGITKGFGIDLLATIIKLISPDFVLQIQSNDQNLNFSISLQPHSIAKYGAPKEPTEIPNYTLFTVRSSVTTAYKNARKSNMIGLTPKVRREIVMLVYLTKAYLDYDERRSDYYKFVKIGNKNYAHCEVDENGKERPQKKKLLECGVWQLVALSDSAVQNNPSIIGYGLAKECREGDESYIFIHSPLSTSKWCEVEGIFYTDGLTLSKSLATLVTRVFDSFGSIPGMVVSNFSDEDGKAIPIRKQLFFD